VSARLLRAMRGRHSACSIEPSPGRAVINQGATRTPFPSDDMATSMKRANLEAILDHPATQWVGFPVAGAAVGAALHPLIIALERARQSQHAGQHHGQQDGRHHGQPGHTHYTKLHHSMLARAGVGGGIAISRALQHTRAPGSEDGLA
jgi:hypothetical protein